MDNSEKVYKVLCKGIILPGFDKEQVIKNIYDLTKIPEKTISRKFFSDKTVVIRHADNQDYAEQLQTSFTAAGIQTTIEEIFTNNSSDYKDELSHNIANNTSHKNLITAIAGFAIIAGLFIVTFFFSSGEENILIAENAVSIKSNDAQNQTVTLSEPIDISRAAEPVINVPEKNKEKLIKNTQEAIELKKPDTLALNGSTDIAKNIAAEEISPTSIKTTNEIAGYYYGKTAFNITLNEIETLLKQEDQDYKNHLDRKTIKLIRKQSQLEKLDSNNKIELYQIDELYIVAQADKILSLTLTVDFLFTDSPYIHGSYSFRVLPVIKRKFPFFISKFINNFNDKDKKWWDENIEILKNDNQAEFIQKIDSEHTIIIKYKAKVSLYSKFSLSDYANKALFNDRLSVTILKN